MAGLASLDLFGVPVGGFGRGSWSGRGLWWDLVSVCICGCAMVKLTCRLC